ncbi:G-type lectin S-receptor-like serine/threonine-protein kinase [Pyrus ussuriensis x Pyrus communis]|uniref:G-type lectin S-receptor-like serine/threonine-protein kinase n=1 Tax=Pyrus ussuriensis x Pyrus communis TaxID=2448454 RepID=A0A5N5G558_9ROSA|nr:G-type lectin S-receptor-like serine/threonine-protein kinase [Pyrus ussuriensis x Pyrus communis]
MALQVIETQNNPNNRSHITFKIHKLRSCKSDTRFPLSQRTIWTELELMVEFKFVDQTGVLDSLKTTRLPSTILNAEENLSETGISLFATQTTILSDATFFEYHMPI